MPLLPNSVEERIEREFDALSPELQRAARWVRQHGATLALNSMRASARHAGVTPATMTRLAQRLGFDGFEALRAPFVARLAAGQPSATPVRPRSGRRHALPETLHELNRLQQANVAAALTLNSPAEIDAVADALLEARRVFFLGMRVSHGVAFQMHYAYSLLADNGSLISNIGGTLSDQMEQVREGTLLFAVSQSPYTRDTVQAVALARSQGAEVLALTDGSLSPIARDAKHVLLFGSASNAYLHSTSGALALIEALLVAIVRRGGERVHKYLMARQLRLQAERAYWEVPGREMKLPRSPSLVQGTPGT